MKVYDVYLHRIPLRARACSGVHMLFSRHTLLEEVFVMPTVVVTGVSSGIGWGTANVMLQHGFQVFGSVRVFRPLLKEDRAAILSHSGATEHDMNM